MAKRSRRRKRIARGEREFAGALAELEQLERDKAQLPFDVVASQAISAASSAWLNGDEELASEVLNEICGPEGFAVLFGMYVSLIESAVTSSACLLRPCRSRSASLSRSTRPSASRGLVRPAPTEHFKSPFIHPGTFPKDAVE